MRALTSDEKKLVRERAYFFWEREGRPDGRAREHWLRAVAEHIDADRHDDDLTSDIELIVDGQPADYPAVLTKDARGG